MRKWFAIAPFIAALAAALVLVAPSAAAQPATSSISIAPKAYVYDLGFLVEAQVTIQCTGGPGSVSMTITQTAAQSSNGTGASGSAITAFESAKCDGSPHKLSVTVEDNSFPALFDEGAATASATLTAPSGTATTTRTIQITHV